MLNLCMRKDTENKPDMVVLELLFADVRTGFAFTNSAMPCRKSLQTKTVTRQVVDNQQVYM